MPARACLRAYPHKIVQMLAATVLLRACVMQFDQPGTALLAPKPLFWAGLGLASFH
jgi:hypothetical protein